MSAKLQFAYSHFTKKGASLYALFYNSWDSAYKSHFGAIARNQSCQFTIRLPEETPLDFSPVLVVFRTGFKERFLPMNVKEHENGYVTYTTDLIPKYSGVHYYYFSYTSNGVRHYIKRGDACHGTLDQEKCSS